MHPAALLPRHGKDEVQSRPQAGGTVGGDHLQVMADQPPRVEAGQKAAPLLFVLAARLAKVRDLPPPLAVRP